MDEDGIPCIQSLKSVQTGVYSLFDWMFDINSIQLLRSLLKGMPILASRPMPKVLQVSLQRGMCPHVSTVTYACS